MEVLRQGSAAEEIEMFDVGQRVKGHVYTNDCRRVPVEGAFVARTNDPEEYIQDIIIRDDAGVIHYIDEQEAFPCA